MSPDEAEAEAAAAMKTAKRDLFVEQLFVLFIRDTKGTLPSLGNQTTLSKLSQQLL